jgi:hypothetical protein
LTRSPPIWRGIGGGVEGKQGFGSRNLKKLHPISQLDMVSLAIDVIRDCCDGSRRHLGLGLVIHGLTDTKLLLYLHFVEN